jgi:hypothetical protein
MARKTNPDNDVVRAAGITRRKPARTVRAKHSAIPAETVTDSAVTAETGTEPTHEDIALLAYSYWLQRGCVDGCPEEDWMRAEQELRSRTNATV